MTSTLISAAAITVWFTYIASSMALIMHKQPWLQWLWLITKWPALAGLITVWVQTALEPGVNAGINALALGGGVWVWWCYRNSGDDDFKRRLKRKAAQRVKALAGRLVVVPNSG